MSEEEHSQQEPELERPLPFLQRLPRIPFAAFSLCLVFFTYQIVGGLITYVLFKAQVNEQNVDLVRWSTMVGQLLLILLPTLLLVKLRYGEVGSFLRIKLPDSKLLILSCVAVFSLQQILQGYMLFQDSIPLPPDVQEAIRQVKELFEEMYRILITAHSPTEFIFVVAVVALTPAVCEEILFRGLIQGSLEPATTGLRAAIIAGIIFGAYHLNPFSFVPLVVLGGYFGFLVYHSRNLSIAIAAHFFNNFVACAAVFMQVKDDFVVFAPAGEPTAAQLLMNYVVFGLVFLVATYYFVKETKPAVDIEE